MVAFLRLDPIPGKNWEPGELEALRTQAVEAIESYLDTSRIDLDGPLISLNDHMLTGLETGEASLGIDSVTPSLLVSDRSANVQRVNTFLKSIGFVGGIMLTPTPTPTPQLRPIS